MFGDFVSKNKKETAATTGKMTDVATGESLPITTVSSDTKITQNDPGVNAYSMQNGEKNSKKAGQGELSLATDTVDETELKAAPITIGTEPYYAGVIIIRETNKQHFYVHEVITKKDRFAVQDWERKKRVTQRQIKSFAYQFT